MLVYTWAPFPPALRVLSLESGRENSELGFILRAWIARLTFSCSGISKASKLLVRRPQGFNMPSSPVQAASCSSSLKGKEVTR